MTGTFILKLLVGLVDTAIRTVIFIVPVALVGHWCEVQPTWKLFAFVAFCSFWSSVVFKENSTEQDERPTVIARTVEVMTPAQVAVAARKATRGMNASMDDH